MARRTRELVLEVMDQWGARGHYARLEGPRPWMDYHAHARRSLAALAGAREHEVVAMAGLTETLHLLMASFWRPHTGRDRIIMESTAFPSDRYAVRSHVQARGFDPDACIIEVPPRADGLLHAEDFAQACSAAGDRAGLLLVGGVNYATGQLLDLGALVAAAHSVGAFACFDLAHAMGNVPLSLHDLGADAAAWCGYKYLNGGQGATAGLFIHERHGFDGTTPRFAGWWGVPLATRMAMERDFVATPGADGWQVSGPSVIGMAPLLASLELFDAAGFDRLRAKSLRLTAFLEMLLRERVPEARVLTPAATHERGAQLSIRLDERCMERHALLLPAGIACDTRRPNVIRAAPAPLFNTFDEVWRFVDALASTR
jgi:kynureninase